MDTLMTFWGVGLAVVSEYTFAAVVLAIVLCIPVVRTAISALLVALMMPFARVFVFIITNVIYYGVVAPLQSLRMASMSDKEKLDYLGKKVGRH